MAEKPEKRLKKVGDLFHKPATPGQQIAKARVEQQSDFRKADAPALGPAFDIGTRNPELFELPGGAMLMFDLSKLTMADYRVMRSHPQINASLSLMTFMLHQMDWKIKCADPKIASVVEDNMRLVWTRLVRAICMSFWAGYAPCVLEWENEPSGKWIYLSKVLDIAPEYAEVNWKEVESSYRPPRPEQTVPKVKVFDGIKKFGLNYPIPPEHCLWYPLLMENGNYYGRKLLKPAFMPWYFSMLIHLYANRYFERFGEPVPIGRAPFDEDFVIKNAADEEVKITGKQAMETMLMNLRNRSIVVLPSDRDPTATSSGGRSEYLYDIEYLESQMRGADFERYLSRLDEEISLSIFTPMLLMRTGNVGSLNLGVQHTQTWLWSLNALANDMKEYIDRYVIQRIKAFNFSEKAPRCEIVFRDMGKDNPETIRAIINQLLSGGTVGVDLEELGVAIGMKLHEVKQIVDPTGGVDTRNRSERDRSTNGPRKVGEPLRTVKQIAARVGDQVRKAWGEPEMDMTFRASLGHRRRMIEAFISEGADARWAEDATDDLYHNVERFSTLLASLGKAEFSGPEDFTGMIEHRLTQEIERLVG